MITLYAEQKKRHRCIEQSFRLCGRRQGWDVSREQHWNVYYLGWNRSPAQVGCMKAFWWRGETCAPSRGSSWVRLFFGRQVPGIGRALESSRLRIRSTESQINHINGHELNHLSRLNIHEFWESSGRWWRTGKHGAAVHGVTKNQTQLRDWTTTNHIQDFSSQTVQILEGF